MITCPSCNHQNPEGSLQCENCYTPLPASTSCPNCGASVQIDATFCGQCGFNLQAESSTPTSTSLQETAIGSMPDVSSNIPEEFSTLQTNPDILPETTMSSPIASPWDDEEEPTMGQSQPTSNVEPTMMPIAEPDLDLTMDEPDLAQQNQQPWQTESSDLDLELDSARPFPQEVESNNPGIFEESEVRDNTTPSIPDFADKPGSARVNNISGATQLQIQEANLLHLQSNTTIEIPTNLDVVHIGKPNGQIPPDIDVAGFADSEVVSRLHADIRIEGDAFYIEDVGSSNGTYVNHAPLLRGNRHRLRSGDRIALGKGDLVTFIFQLN